MTTRRFPDPYEGTSDDELDRRSSGLLATHRERQQAISIRFPEELLTTLRQVADEVGIGYQTLIKSLLEKDVERLRARPLRPRKPARRTPRRVVPRRILSTRQHALRAPAHDP
jgi:hypothetical protein